MHTHRHGGRDRPAQSRTVTGTPGPLSDMGHSLTYRKVFRLKNNCTLLYARALYYPKMKKKRIEIIYWGKEVAFKLESLSCLTRDMLYLMRETIQKQMQVLRKVETARDNSNLYMSPTILLDL